jgi:hypothetical protein
VCVRDLSYGRLCEVLDCDCWWPSGSAWA